MYGILGLTEEDAGCYKFYELFELPVDANILIEDLKELVK